MIYVTQEMRLTNKRTLSLTGYWFSFNRKKANRNLQQQANSLQLEKKPADGPNFQDVDTSLLFFFLRLPPSPQQLNGVFDHCVSE